MFWGFRGSVFDQPSDPLGCFSNPAHGLKKACGSVQSTMLFYPPQSPPQSRAEHPGRCLGCRTQQQNAPAIGLKKQQLFSWTDLQVHPVDSIDSMGLRVFQSKRSSVSSVKPTQRPHLRGSRTRYSYKDSPKTDQNHPRKARGSQCLWTAPWTVRRS